MKYGRLPKQEHPNTLRMAKYFETLTLPSPHEKVYREYKTPPEAKLMFGNDRYGDCVWAMFANKIIHDSIHAGVVIIPTLEQVLEAYAAVTGFNPQTGANDNGTVMVEALAYMQSTGIAGHKILGWGQIDHTNRVHRNLGCDFFGSTLVGVNFPDSAMNQFAQNRSWELVSSQLDGGHAILRPGYGAAGDDYATWARWDQKASAAWSYAYVDEEYICITPEWFDIIEHTSLKDAIWADLKALSV
jgi:hypothetical protein